MREILVQSDAGERAAQLEPALDALELRERLQRRGGRNADVSGSRDCRERVLEVVLAEQRPAPRPTRRSLLEDTEARLHPDGSVSGEPARGAVARAECRERRPQSALEQPLDVRVLAVGDDEAVAGNRPQQLVELPNDRVDV